MIKFGLGPVESCEHRGSVSDVDGVLELSNCPCLGAPPGVVGAAFGAASCCAGVHAPQFGESFGHDVVDHDEVGVGLEVLSSGGGVGLHGFFLSERYALQGMAW